MGRFVYKSFDSAAVSLCDHNAQYQQCDKSPDISIPPLPLGKCLLQQQQQGFMSGLTPCHYKLKKKISVNAKSLSEGVL
ncbi:hypothetical protein JOB18_000843 [Solea senegalensis]|uniref:Uncharacterized protein n=1 Tax=Solea senegalensis TaxID=28829 RepID=A0AAV6R786_SOLSE|nr:hypothetical protein JOB18_000843 [Solea senegalensis]